MRERILNYRKEIDALLSSKPEGTNWEEVLNNHLIQIGFFCHERLIHLIVTVTFAILTLMSIMTLVITSNQMFFLLTVMCLALLIPYVMHYYTLENEVQKMYVQYDKLLKLK